MYSTHKNTTSDIPSVKEGAIAGRYLSYPDQAGNRIAQGGLRTQGIYKQSLPNLPLVTIITVCLNSSKTMEQCIQSVLMQNYTNIEYIIIDGISTDGTLDLIGQYENAIDYYLSEPDRGLYHAMNKGIELASGDYILILNSDDWYVSDCVESLVKAKIYSGLSFVSGLAQYVDQHGKPLELMRHMSYDESVYIRMPLRHETMLISAAIYNEIGSYDETYRIIGDSQLTVRLFDAGHTLYELQRPLLFFRDSGVSNTNITGRFKERSRLIKEKFPFLEDTETQALSDPRNLTPEKLLEIAEKYPNKSDLNIALQLYYSDRKKTSQVKLWKESEINWPSIKHTRPTVSVIMPVFNARNTLKECIESVLSQSLTNLELICVNDASPDDSQKIIDLFQANDSRVISLINEINIGQGPSRNKALRLARGEYIFFIDSDDTIPPKALEFLYMLALKHDSDIVRGAFIMEQSVFGKNNHKQEKRSLCPSTGPIINTRLADMPELLRTTEGHWSQLYKSGLAKSVRYHDLRIGQDSIFLVSILLRAEKVSLTDEIVYYYRANPASAMNTFSFLKHLHALEWRRRAWHLLNDAGMNAIGDRLLQAYWGDAFFIHLVSNTDATQIKEFFDKFRKAFSEAGISTLKCKTSDFLMTLFPLILAGRDEDARSLLISRAPTKDKNPTKNLPTKKNREQSIVTTSTPINTDKNEKNKLKVATFCSLDHGGAGTGTQRRVEALRRYGVDARIFSLVVQSSHPYVQRIVPDLPSIDTTQQLKVWEKAREHAILPAKQVPGFCAKELFSLTDSVVDFSKLTKLFNEFDIIHFHWVVGMLDFKQAGKYLADKPIVWTLADMNAFTGGCHYSEGCEEYKKECKQCPLLGGKSDLAHKTWKIKLAAYQQLKNLHIICPSKWMAERVAQSSLLGDKHIHYIPNAFPIDRLTLINKKVARIQLGLPLNKNLLLFGADSLVSHRKGSDMLRKAIDIFSRKNKHIPVEIVVFGKNTINLPIPVHNLGYISDDNKLALAYSAADTYLFPSREDNAPLTVGEALLCGTPVVAFSVGHVPDIIQHGITGYIAKNLDADDFAKGINWALNVEPKASILRSMTCRQSGSLFHDPLIAVERHVTVYSAAMHGNN